MNDLPVIVLSRKIGKRKQEKGIVIRQVNRPCSLEGCRGVRLSVRWKDGTITYPCSQGLKPINKTMMQIV